MADPSRSQGQPYGDARPTPPRDGHNRLPPNVQHAPGHFPPNQGPAGQFNRYQVPRGRYQGQQQQQYHQGPRFNLPLRPQGFAGYQQMGSTEDLSFQQGGNPYAAPSPGFKQGYGGQYWYDQRLRQNPQGPPGMRQQPGWQTPPRGQYVPQQQFPGQPPVQAWQQQPQTPPKGQHPDEGDESPKEPIRTVLVTGIEKGISNDTLPLYFESKRKSGGGNIENITFNPDRSAVIIFEDHEAAARVCQRKVHEFQRNKWTVTLQSVPEKSTTTTVVVSGLDISMKDTVEMYFESEKRSGGGEIENIEFRKREAYITFKDAEVVQRVLSRLHKLEGKQVVVKPGTTAPENTIAVTEHGNVSSDTLQMYFESKRRSCGGEILETWEENDVFYIKFKNEEDFNRVLDKDNHQVSGVNLTVVKAGEEPEVDEAQEKAPEASRVVEIRGYQKDSTDDAIILYFENKRKSGGGDVEIISRNDKKGIILLEFTTSEVAERVASKEHTLSGHQLKVKLSQPLVMYKDRILLKGVPECSEDTLMDFLDAKTQLDVSGFLYGDEEGDIMVSFETPFTDFATLSQSIRRKDFMKTKLQVLEVPHTTYVTVRHLPENISAENIGMYFENKRRSGGDDVEDTILKDEDCSAVVKFNEPSVAERVCKRQHELGRSKVEVSLHFECLGDSGGSPEKPCTKIPDPVDVTGLDHHVLQYLNANMPAMESVKNAVGKSYGKIEIDQTNKAIKLSPTFTKEDKEAKKFAKTWTDDVKKTLLECLDAFEVTKVGVNEDIWADVEPKMNLLGRQDVHVYTEEHNLIIVIVGQKGRTTEMVEKVKNIRNTIQEDYDRKKNQVRLHKSFGVCKVKLLRAKGMLPESYDDYVTIQCNLETGEVDFIGPDNDVQKVVLNVYELVNTVMEQTIRQFDGDMLELMRRPAVFQFLDEKQKNHPSWPNATWIADTREVKVYSTNGGFKKMLQFLQDAIQERVIPLDNENISILKTTGFRTEIDKIQKEKGRVIISPLPQQRRIHLTAVKEDIDVAYQAVDDYIQTNSIYVMELPYSQAVSEFISCHCKDKLDSIQQDLKQYCVTFEFKGNGSTRKIVLKATKKGKDQAKMFLDPIAGGVKCHEEVLKKIGIDNFLDTNDILRQVEMNTRCIIKRTPPTDTPAVKSPFDVGVDCETAFTCNPCQNKTITIVVGDYAFMATKVEAIVVETTPELKADTAQASSVMNRAGDEVASDAKRKYLYEGDIHSTSSGLLPRPCKRIILAVGPEEESNNDPGSVLKAVVGSSMDETSKYGRQSVALPSFDLPSVRRSMSTDDKFRYILEGIKEFFNENPHSSVADVYLCLSTTQQCQTVWGQTVSVFGQDKIAAKNAEKLVEEEPEQFGWRHGRTRFGGTREPLNISREAYQEMSYADTGYKHESSDVQLQKPRILLVKTDMGREEADVIVSSSNTSLDLSRGMVSKSLLKHAGDSIQEECKAKYPEGIKLGEIAVTKGGEMQCVEHIYHCVLPNYDANTGQQVLVDTLNSLLLKAHREKWKTIAIPALGTGNLGYSRDLVAKTMYETVTQFGKDHPETTLNDVLFIVYPGDKESCRIFEAENKKHVEARGGKVADSQEEIDEQREEELTIYREKLIRDKEIRDQQSPQPQPEPRPQSSGGWWSGFTNMLTGKKNPQEAPDFSNLNRSSSSKDVTLWIYTDDDRQVTAARDLIIKMMEGEEQTRTVNEPSITGWSNDQIKKLENMQYKHSVTINVNKRLGRIVIIGLLSSLSEAHTEIVQTIRSMDNAKEEQKYAEEVQKLVQWYHQETELTGVTKMSPYDALINAKLEKAFCKKESELVLNGIVYDFNDWVEYPKRDKSVAVNIIRKDLLQATSTKPPETWEDKGGDIAIVPLDTGTPEYKKVEKNITDSFAGNPVEIVEIHRVQNKTLYQQYKTKYQQMERQNPGVEIEMMLWHGTKVDNATNITTRGFNRSDTSQSTYGEGVYFPTTAPAAASDTYAPAGGDNKRVIFQSKVLIGNYTLGDNSYRVAPQRGAAKTDLYDSVVDDVNAPTVFVIFSDTQAYPEYQVTIKC